MVFRLVDLFTQRPALCRMVRDAGSWRILMCCVSSTPTKLCREDAVCRAPEVCGRSICRLPNGDPLGLAVPSLVGLILIYVLNFQLLSPRHQTESGEELQKVSRGRMYRLLSPPIDDVSPRNFDRRFLPSHRSLGHRRARVARRINWGSHIHHVD